MENFKELGANSKANNCESNISIKLGDQLIKNENCLMTTL